MVNASTYSCGLEDDSLILFVSPKTSVKYFIDKTIAIKMMISLMAIVDTKLIRQELPTPSLNFSHLFCFP